MSLLFIAVASGKSESVQTLLCCGADPNDINDPVGDRVLVGYPRIKYAAEGLPVVAGMISCPDDAVRSIAHQLCMAGLLPETITQMPPPLRHWLEAGGANAAVDALEEAFLYRAGLVGA
jgi:hypothetical protein